MYEENAAKDSGYWNVNSVNGERNVNAMITARTVTMKCIKRCVKQWQILEKKISLFVHCNKASPAVFYIEKIEDIITK